MNSPAADRLLKDKVYDDLLRLLGTPGFESQARMPGENAMAQRLSVSRPVLRQALARLREEGRIHTRKGSGNFVAEVLPQGKGMDYGPLTNIPDIRAFLEFRCSIEGEAAARAALNCTPAQMADIRLHRERFDAALAAGDSAMEEDIAFHAAIAQASGNRFYGMTLAALAQQTRFAIGLVRSLGGRSRDDRLSDVRREHATIEAAIAQGDAAAARLAMEEHLKSGIDRLFGH